MQIIEAQQTVDTLFEKWETSLGGDYQAYRNHAYRVFNIACALADASAEDREKLAVAAAFHDIGIWLDNTFDYLGPSVQRALGYLATIGRQAWGEPITHIIAQHHKVLPWRGKEFKLVEAFRRADWFDVCLFMLPTPLSPPLPGSSCALFPEADSIAGSLFSPLPGLASIRLTLCPCSGGNDRSSISPRPLRAAKPNRQDLSWIRSARLFFQPPACLFAL